MGANNFIAFVPIPAGSQVGPLPAVDLFALVPASGIDSPFTVICSGDFEGTIAVEGSLDGTNFNPAGSFLHGPPGNPNALEPSPINISDTVRFVRLRIMPGTIIREVVEVTLGGAENCGCGGTGGFLTEEVFNASGSDLQVGEVVRMSNNDAVTRSRADVTANAQGTIGVVGSGVIPDGQVGAVVTEGKTVVLLEVGLVGVAAGQTLWVSPTTFGRATNVKPMGAGNAELCIGVIKDATNYALDNTVVADVDVDCEPAVAGLVASIQCGKETFLIETTKAVVFAFPFPSPPAVVLTPLDQNNVTLVANLDAAPTALGFTIRMSAAYTGTVHWIACTD